MTNYNPHEPLCPGQISSLLRANLEKNKKIKDYAATRFSRNKLYNLESQEIKILTIQILKS